MVCIDVWSKLVLPGRGRQPRPYKAQPSSSGGKLLEFSRRRPRSGKHALQTKCSSACFETNLSGTHVAAGRICAAAGICCWNSRWNSRFLTAPTVICLLPQTDCYQQHAHTSSCITATAHQISAPTVRPVFPPGQMFVVCGLRLSHAKPHAPIALVYRAYSCLSMSMLVHVRTCP